MCVLAVSLVPAFESILPILWRAESLKSTVSAAAAGDAFVTQFCARLGILGTEKRTRTLTC